MRVGGKTVSHLLSTKNQRQQRLGSRRKDSFHSLVPPIPPYVPRYRVKQRLVSQQSVLSVTCCP